MLRSPKLSTSFVRTRSIRFKAFFALALVSFFWGTTWIASKEGVRHMPALQMVGIRQLAGGMLYMLFFISKGRTLPRGREWIPILVLSFLNFVLSNTLSTWGVKYISAGLGSIIGATFPIWMVVIGFSNKSFIPLKAAFGFIIGFAGICVVFYDHLADFLNPDFLFGIIISLMATWAWAFGTIYTKRFAKEFNPYFSLGIQMVISSVFILSIARVSGTTIPVSAIPWESWASILYLVVFGSVISFVAYLYALQHLRAEQTSIYAYINPVVAIIFGALFFEERLTVFIVVGGAITLYGVYMINKAFRKAEEDQMAFTPSR